MVRCPFSLARVVRVTESGSVIYRAEKSDCRRFPQAASADLRGGPRRNFQVFDVFDFLAELTQHIPDKGEHLVRYYGCYSHRRLGMPGRGLSQFSPGDCPNFRPDENGTVPLDGNAPFARREIKIDRSLVRDASARAWAMLIQRVYEVDPLICPQCGGAMRIISFIEARQSDVIEKILRHCGLWEGPLRTLAAARAPPRGGAQGTVPNFCSTKMGLSPSVPALGLSPSVPASNERPEPRLVLDPEYAGLSERSEPAGDPSELQLVLDPEFL
jgi:hypothetical protein